MEERKHRSLKLWVRITLFLILICGITIPIFTFLFFINQKQPKKLIYASNINQDINYNVLLFDNNFVNTTTMDENQIYISDLVKNIKLNFNYNYSATKHSKLVYTYSIDGTLYGETVNQETGNKEIVWEKKYNLLKEKKFDTQNANFNINQNLDIDYLKYKEEVNEFKKRFGMNLTTKLQVVMKIKVDGEYEYKKTSNKNQRKTFNKENEMVLNIPLGTQAFSITKDYEKQSHINLYENNLLKSKKYLIYSLSCMLITILSTILFIFSFKAIFNIKRKSEYTKELNKILKAYGQIIVEVTTPIKERGFNVIIVKNFNEMIDLEEELRIPIIFYENAYTYSSIFTLTHENTIYKYILKNKKD